MVTYNLYYSSKTNEKIIIPKKSNIPHGFTKIENTCPLTGITIKQRGKFWDYVKAKKITRTKMKYDYTLDIVNNDNLSKLLNKTHLEWLWLNYFNQKYDKKDNHDRDLFDGLIGKINLVTSLRGFSLIFIYSILLYLLLFLMSNQISKTLAEYLVLLLVL